MKPGCVLAAGVLAIAVLAQSTLPLTAQTNIPGAAGPEMVRNLRPSGRPVIPIFDGWHPNPDGSHGLCFGYFNLNLEQVLDMETELQGQLAGTEDFQEGVKAFLEKRRPTFKGR